MTLLINAVKKAASPLNRDFSEIERLQSSVKSYKDFVVFGLRKSRPCPAYPNWDALSPIFRFAVDGQPNRNGSCFVCCAD